ncbi:MAG: hypothetical protein KatS3mg039_1178 [Candidatus Kapaibacterium sp.]|nr:MAG: hypothetical protein KatS3mg039_1178 [Candidatus Kapabacteria bacterium]
MWAIYSGDRGFALVLGVVALASDALDGAIARRYGAESELGRILDPLADKVLAASVAVALLWQGAVPLWYAATVIGRDVVIVAGGLALRSRVGSVPPSLPIGKVAATSIGIVLLAAIAGIGAPLLDGLALVSSALLGWSLLVYAARLWGAIRPQRTSH